MITLPKPCHSQPWALIRRNGATPYKQLSTLDQRGAGARDDQPVIAGRLNRDFLSGTAAVPAAGVPHGLTAEF